MSTDEKHPTVLELAILVGGGFFLMILLRGAVNATLGERIVIASIIDSAVFIGWLALVIHFGTAFVRVRRAPVDAAVTAAAPRAPFPTFSLVAIACALLVVYWVVSTIRDPVQGRGESAQIGLAAVGILCLFGLVTGIGSGLAAVRRKERRELAWAGLLVNVGVATVLVSLLARL